MNSSALLLYSPFTPSMDVTLYNDVLDVICQVCCIDVLFRIAKACHRKPLRRKLGPLPELQWIKLGPLPDIEGIGVILPIGETSAQPIPGNPSLIPTWRNTHYRKAYILSSYVWYGEERKSAIYIVNEPPFIFDEYRRKDDGIYVLSWAFPEGALY